MKEAIHLRFDNSEGSHQRITIFMDGANCGQLTMRPEEALWFHHIVDRGCEFLRLTFNATGSPIEPNDSKIDRFAKDHTVKRKRG